MPSGRRSRIKNLGDPQSILAIHHHHFAKRDDAARRAADRRELAGCGRVRQPLRRSVPATSRSTMRRAAETEFDFQTNVHSVAPRLPEGGGAEEEGGGKGEGGCSCGRICRAESQRGADLDLQKRSEEAASPGLCRHTAVAAGHDGAEDAATWSCTLPTDETSAVAANPEPGAGVPPELLCARPSDRSPRTRVRPSTSGQGEPRCWKADGRSSRHARLLPAVTRYHRSDSAAGRSSVEISRDTACPEICEKRLLQSSFPRADPRAIRSQFLAGSSVCSPP